MVFETVANGDGVTYRGGHWSDSIRGDDWKNNAQGKLEYDENLTKKNASTQLKKGESYVAKSFVAKDQNDDYYNFSDNGKKYKIDSNSISADTEVINVTSNWRTLLKEEEKMSNSEDNSLAKLGSALAISQADSPIPGPADLFSALVVVKVLYEAVTNDTTVTEQILEFAHGKKKQSTGKLTDKHGKSYTQG